MRRTGAGAAGLRIGSSYGETLKLAMAQHPATQHVFIVSPPGPARELIRARFRDVGTRATLTFLHEPSVSRLLAAIREVPPRSVIVYQFYWQNEPGQRMYPHEVAARYA